MANSTEPVTIKKYANRRLYNTGTISYVTLEDLATMVKAGEDFVVYDAKTGEDITRSVLAQIIFEQENKEGQNLLPINFLRQLIRFYGDSMQMLVPRYLEVSIESLTREQEKFRQQIAQAFGTGAFGRSARSKTRCGGTWRCSSAPSRCSRRSPSARRQAEADAAGARQRRPAAGGPTRSTISSARWKRCRSGSTASATRTTADRRRRRMSTRLRNFALWVVRRIGVCKKNQKPPG